MKKLNILLLTLFVTNLNLLNAQIFWTEDFDGGANGTDGFTGANGVWTMNPVGTNGTDQNVWYVNSDECGNTAGACGSTCAGDNSLFVGFPIFWYGLLGSGAAYLAGGGFGDCTTNKRMESPTINCSGKTNITLQFNYFEDGTGNTGYDPDDDATLWYFDGTTWALLDPLVVTSGSCLPQGSWTAFSISLPLSADNNPNVKIGFQWVNDCDLTGTDPTFAVDDIALSTPITLPIQFKEFNVNCRDDFYEIFWSSFSEHNNDYYTLEKSRDGINFELLAVIDGKGNSSNLNTYQYIDYEAVSQRTVYYRLKQTDLDGKTEILKVKAVDCMFNKISIYPNPTNDIFYIDLNKQINISIEIYDLNGKLLENYFLKNKVNKIDLSNFPVGIYYIKLFEGDKKVSHHKIEKL